MTRHVLIATLACAGWIALALGVRWALDEPAAEPAPASADGVFGFTVIPEQSPVVVAAVNEASPAAAAGLVPGDRIVAADGEPVRTPADLARLGGRVELVVARAGRRRRIVLHRAPMAAIVAGVGLTPLGADRFGYAEPPLAPGDRADGLVLPLIDGRTIDLAAEPAVTVVVWSPGCPPSSNELAHRAAGPVKVVGVTLARDPAFLRHVLAERGIEIPQAALPYFSRLAARLGLYEENLQVDYPQVFRFERGHLVERRG